MAELVRQIEKLILPVLHSMGFSLVQVKLLEGNKNRLLQIMAERPDGTISLDDCADISQQVSAILDVEDIMPTAYRLEVSSPGIDRPLVKHADFEKYMGHTAKIELIIPANGRRRFTGVLKSVVGDTVTLEVDGQLVAVEIPDIQSAKLVLTDALIKEHTQKQA